MKPKLSNTSFVFGALFALMWFQATAGIIGKVPVMRYLAANWREESWPYFAAAAALIGGAHWFYKSGDK